MMAVYVVLDGFDLGAGIVHLFVARTDAERRPCSPPSARCGTATRCGCWPAAARCTSPFPALYASGFSGFYLP